MMKVNQVIAVLRYIVFCTIGIVVLMGILFETHLLQIGFWESHHQTEFVLTSVMELVTICAIPLSLRLFHFKKVRDSLQSQGEKALLPWGTGRLLLICLPLLVNALCYWLFSAPGFGYMAIILFLCLFFIYPSKERCLTEIRPKE